MWQDRDFLKKYAKKGLHYGIKECNHCFHSWPSHQFRKDNLTLFLCANASEDFKVKHLFMYHSKNPWAFKKCKTSCIVHFTLHEVCTVNANVQCIQETQDTEELIKLMWRSISKDWVICIYLLRSPLLQ